ncbi:MAG: PspC domain-containing protein [Firmicutes bacterium]|nr:PspC domain-containing protein [Bacillota bacterium]MDI6822834.1 PspC domain-containing protein [Bacillota bacterium]MDI7250564.1 PspC domain-containing protein [Bacillota bacterium]
MKRLYRDRDNRWLGGVAAGMAQYLGVDVTVARLCWALSIFVFGPLAPLAYLAAWAIIPPEPKVS